MPRALAARGWREELQGLSLSVEWKPMPPWYSPMPRQPPRRKSPLGTVWAVQRPALLNRMEKVSQILSGVFLIICSCAK